MTMGISEKLNESLECAKNGNIVLYKEGMFWKAYDSSAYLFIKEIKEYLVLKKHIKSISDDVVFLGFPALALDKVLSGLKYNQDGDKLVVNLSSTSFFEKDFLEWKENVKLSDSASKAKINTDKLPVFKNVYDLLLSIYVINKNISREYKFSLVENIKNEILDLLVIIHKVASGKNVNNISLIGDASDYVLRVILQIRVLYDLKQISLKKYSELCKQVDVITRQLDNFKK